MSTRAGRVILLEEVLKEGRGEGQGIIREKNPDLAGRGDSQAGGHGGGNLC